MSTLTIDIPSELVKIIELHKEIDWKSIAQKSLLEYARKITLADRLTNESTLSDKDVEVLNGQIKTELTRKFL